jgi:hypothetical protein
VAEQNLDFNIIAHTQGMEQIANLINRVGALEAETKKLAAANTGLAASTDSVIRNGKRYNTALDAQSKSIRNTRMGVTQLGMQFNDLATSISTGASPVQAFNQQIGQIGFALSMMSGRVGMLGRLIAGPLGIALIGATVLMSQFKGKTEETEDSTANFGDYAIATFQSIGEQISNGLQPAVEALGPAIDALSPVVQALQTVFENLGYVGKTVANFILRAFVTAINAIAILAGNSFSMVAEGVLNVVNGGIFAINKLISMAEGRLNAFSNAVNKIDDIFQTGFRLDKVDFGRLTPVVNEFKGTTLKAFSDIGKAATATFNTDFMDFGDISKKANAFAAARAAAEAAKDKKGGSAKGANSGKAAKEKAAFSLKGFYEEFFAKEFEKNDESLAKMAETQIKSLIDTIPDLAKISPEMENIISRNEEVQRSFEEIGNSVSDAFKGMLTGAMSWKDGMRSLISSVIDQLWKLFVVQKIVGFVSSALGGMTGTPSSGGSFGSSTGNYLPGIPANAYGGSVMGNRPTLVGERGPELFVPGGNGTIIPNSNMRGGGGGSSFNISVDARGSNDPAAVRAQVMQGILETAPAIIAAAESRTISNLRRPRLGGAMQ